MKASAVFTPGSFPKITYVSRDDAKFETQLAEALDTPGMAISVSGPSKSGKTVLVQKVLAGRAMCTISGAHVQTADELWIRILEDFDIAEATTETVGHSIAAQSQASAEGKVGVPFVAEGSVQGGAGFSATRTTASAKVRKAGLLAAVSALEESNCVLFIDDFHYIEAPVQAMVARQLKSVLERITVCTASVPHHASDALRANPDLRGRVVGIDIPYWSEGDLCEIARLGFSSLNALVEDHVLEAFAKEAAGSPQLMQSICLAACRRKDLRTKLKHTVPVPFAEAELTATMIAAASIQPAETVAKALLAGPDARGTRRKAFTFKDEDGLRGDTYAAILYALALDPPSQSFSYEDLKHRLRAAVGEVPASLRTRLQWLDTIAKDNANPERALEWDEETSTLDIPDPYLFFYLRRSDFLRTEIQKQTLRFAQLDAQNDRE